MKKFISKKNTDDVILLKGRDNKSCEDNVIKLDNGLMFQFGAIKVSDEQVFEVSDEYISSPVLLVSRDHANNASVNAGIYHHWISGTTNKFYIYCETPKSNIWMHYLAIGRWK